MNTEDCLLLIKQIMELADSNAKLTARVESYANEIFRWRDANASLQARMDATSVHSETKALQMANASIYSLEREVDGHKKTIIELADELNQLKKRGSIEVQFV